MILSRQCFVILKNISCFKPSFISFIKWGNTNCTYTWHPHPSQMDIQYLNKRNIWRVKYFLENQFIASIKRKIFFKTWTVFPRKHIKDKMQLVIIYCSLKDYKSIWNNCRNVCGIPAEFRVRKLILAQPTTGSKQWANVMTMSLMFHMTNNPFNNFILLIRLY